VNFAVFCEIEYEHEHLLRVFMGRVWRPPFAVWSSEFGGTGLEFVVRSHMVFTISLR